MQSRWREPLFSGAQYRKQWAQTGTLEVPSKYQEATPCKHKVVAKTEERAACSKPEMSRRSQTFADPFASPKFVSTVFIFKIYESKNMTENYYFFP